MCETPLFEPGTHNLIHSVQAESLVVEVYEIESEGDDEGDRYAWQLTDCYGRPHRSETGFMTDALALQAGLNVALKKPGHGELIAFSDIPLGGRFRYPGSDRVWTLLSRYQEGEGERLSGSIAEWRPGMMTFGKWLGQSLCGHFANDETCPEMVVAVD